MSDNRPIGVFDSGLGGLTAVTHIVDLLPDEKFVYFGDTARTPYGSKTVATIKKFSLQITNFLQKHNVKAIVIACNTVSATCKDFIQERCPKIPVFGIIEPTAELVARTYSKNNNIGIIGTKVTTESKQYEITIKNYNGNCHIYSKACPLFVPVIEEGIRDKHIMIPIIKYYLDEFLEENNITDLILGCTHYPMLQNFLHELYPSVNIINPSEVIAVKIRDVLENYELLATPNNKVNHFYASDLSKGFISMINDILPDKQHIIQFKKFDDPEER